jgi:hypothetical protein
VWANVVRDLIYFRFGLDSVPAAWCTACADVELARDNFNSLGFEYSGLKSFVRVLRDMGRWVTCRCDSRAELTVESF